MGVTQIVEGAVAGAALGGIAEYGLSYGSPEVGRLCKSVFIGSQIGAVTAPTFYGIGYTKAKEEDGMLEDEQTSMRRINNI